MNGQVIGLIVRQGGHLLLERNTMSWKKMMAHSAYRMMPTWISMHAQHSAWNIPLSTLIPTSTTHLGQIPPNFHKHSLPSQSPMKSTIWNTRLEFL